MNETDYKRQIIKKRKENNIKQSYLPDEQSDDDQITLFINIVIDHHYPLIQNIEGMGKSSDERQKRFYTMRTDVVRMIKYLATYKSQMESTLYAKMMYGYVKGLILTQSQYEEKKRLAQEKRISYFQPLQTSEITNLTLKSYMMADAQGIKLESNKQGTIRVVGIDREKRKTILKQKVGSEYYLLKLVRAHNEYIRKKQNIKRIIQDVNYDIKKFNKRFLKAAVTGKGGFKKLLNDSKDFKTYKGDIYSYAKAKTAKRINDKAAILSEQYQQKIQRAIQSRTTRFDYYKTIIESQGKNNDVSQAKKVFKNLKRTGRFQKQKQKKKKDMQEEEEAIMLEPVDNFEALDAQVETQLQNMEDLQNLDLEEQFDNLDQQIREYYRWVFLQLYSGKVKANNPQFRKTNRDIIDLAIIQLFEIFGHNQVPTITLFQLELTEQLSGDPDLKKELFEFLEFD